MRLIYLVVALTGPGLFGASLPSKVVPILWRDPNPTYTLDFAAGVGGPAKAPTPPFKFVQENLGGHNPKIQVTDATGALWNVKWGEEVHAEVFVSRLVWAAGYVVQPMYFVERGRVLDAGPLTRAKQYLDAEGNFTNARFQLWDKDYKFLKTAGWSWNDNPFVGTPELDGLKILMMLTSNWDAKDARDGSATNTGILEHNDEAGTERLYFASDWGGTMGRWGRAGSRDKWNCAGYMEQTPQLIKGVRGGTVLWGYHGRHTDLADGISVSDVKWILRYLAAISDDQLATALRASGASLEETACFTGAVRSRIDELKRATREAATAGYGRSVS